MPAYCEAGTIGDVVAAVVVHAPVIVVDDCSSDGTAAMAERAGATVIRNNSNLGYEGALNRGFEAAAAKGYEVVVTMDADGEHAPSTIVAFAKSLLDDEIPLVLGVRPRKQRFSEVVMGAYIKLRFGVDDILCGMKGYHMSLWRENGGFDRSSGIGTELALNSLRRGTAFRQLPVSGTARRDAPRFDTAIRANVRILLALLRALRLRGRHDAPAANEGPQ